MKDPVRTVRLNIFRAGAELGGKITTSTNQVPYPWLPLNSLALQFPEVRIARGKVVASLCVAHYTRVLTHATHPT